MIHLVMTVMDRGVDITRQELHEARLLRVEKFKVSLPILSGRDSIQSKQNSRISTSLNLQIMSTNNLRDHRQRD